MTDRLTILWAKAGRLLPVDTGGKIRSYHLARALARRHEVTMLTWYDGQRDAAYEEAMAREFPGAVTLRAGPRRVDPLSAGLRYAAGLFTGAPFAIRKFTTSEVRALIDQWAGERRFDAMVCDFLSASLHFSRPESMPVVLFQHNVEASLWARQAQHETNPVLRAVYGLEAARMRRYEREALRRFRHVVAVSPHDRDLMSADVDPARITVVPTGVNVDQFASAASQEPSGPTVLFLGSMDWEANIDGVEWMAESIWPTVLASVPDARFRIVGRNPHGRVLRLAGPSIEVTGAVPSVTEYLAEAQVVVVPLRIGGGTRLKIFEAMAAARAVVSTSVGAEGLPVTHGVDLLLADDPDAFARAVIEVLRTPDRRRSLGRAALALAREHDWSRVAGVMEQAIDRVRERSSDAGRPG